MIKEIQIRTFENVEPCDYGLELITCRVRVVNGGSTGGRDYRFENDTPCLNGVKYLHASTNLRDLLDPFQGIELNKFKLIIYPQRRYGNFFVRFDWDDYEEGRGLARFVVKDGDDYAFPFSDVEPEQLKSWGLGFIEKWADGGYCDLVAELFYDGKRVKWVD